jgi:thymidylate synthase ThyX
MNFGLQLSPAIKIAVRMDQAAMLKINELARQALQDLVDNHPDIAKSLKSPNLGKARVMRGMDIRGKANSPVIIQFYFWWHHELDMWGVLAQSPSENYVESNQIQEILN